MGMRSEHIFIEVLSNGQCITSGLSRSVSIDLKPSILPPPARTNAYCTVILLHTYARFDVFAYSLHCLQKSKRTLPAFRGQSLVDTLASLDRVRRRRSKEAQLPGSYGACH